MERRIQLLNFGTDFKKACCVFQAAVLTGWALSVGMTFILVHGLYGELGPVMSAAYVALSHTAWAVAVAWIVIACCTGNGGQQFYLTRSLSVSSLHVTID